MALNIPPGPYNIAVAPINNNVQDGFFLTNNGEGKQLTVESATGEANQIWYIIPTDDAGRCTITPEPVSPACVSEDDPSNPDQVFLLKKLQRWVFNLLPNTRDIYEVIVYNEVVGVQRLLGVDKNNEKVIIKGFPIFAPEPDSVKPAWQLTPLKKY